MNKKIIFNITEFTKFIDTINNKNVVIANMSLPISYPVCIVYNFEEDIMNPYNMIMEYLFVYPYELRARE